MLLGSLVVNGQVGAELCILVMRSLPSAKGNPHAMRTAMDQDMDRPVTCVQGPYFVGYHLPLIT